VTATDVHLAEMLEQLKEKPKRNEHIIQLIIQHLGNYESKRGEGYGKTRRAAI
jgi:hypothetical protein